MDKLKLEIRAMDEVGLFHFLRFLHALESVGLCHCFKLGF